MAEQHGNALVACVCAREESSGKWRERCIQYCGISLESLESWTFGHWAKALNPGCNEAMRAVENFANSKTGVPWLVLFGEPGLGKTHLLVAAVGLLAANGVEARYYPAYDLEARIKEAIPNHEVQALVRELASISVLALDDLGTELQSEFVKAEFHAILDRRYQEGRRTIISMNPQSWKTMPARLLDRLRDFRVAQVLEMTGESVRPRQMA